VIDAVLSTSFDQLVDIQHRIDALREAKEWKDFESIVIGFKRAMNIIKGVSSLKKVDPSLFSEIAEKNLFKSLIDAKGKIDRLLDQRDYPASLLEMSRMKKTIDEFFDKVMVMVEDEAIRNNRLSLLDGIGQLFLRFADFSKLT
jgi:glycyl-tRNA synthetase beta chain